ncbi:hypothetical protein LINGRAHAP2_LOCUS16850 [Linum grandiflorum]
MRGRGFTIPTNFIGSHASRNSPSFFAPFSTSSSGRGRGGGRGQISTPGPFSFTADEEKPQNARPEQPPVAGLGHGRGKPLAASGSSFPEFTSFISTLKVAADPAVGRGRGVAAEGPRPSRAAGERQQQAAPGQPPKSSVPSNEPYLPSSLRTTLQSFGRGKSDVPVAPGIPEKEVNRHIRSARIKPRADGGDGGDGATGDTFEARPRRFNQEAVAGERRSGGEGSEGRRRGEGGMQQMGGRGREMGMERGRGRGRGRGMGRGRGRGRGRERGEYAGGRERDDKGGEESDEGEDIELGNNADGEKLAQTFGVEFMNELVDGFEEMSSRVLPSPLEDEFIDALDLNCKIEFEEEYIMGEFDLNPDIDEKPPMPLRDMLEKVKPFLMCYEGIQNQAEWEEVMEETMRNVPLLKKIVDHYAGPDRVTAKQQQQELERVAGTLPAIAPPSVKRFADRAALSLQSNPGWGFDKKCQFMDKLVMEVSQHYK